MNKLERQIAWRAANREHCRRLGREYWSKMKSDPQKLEEKKRKKREYDIEYRKKNRERLAAAKKAWGKTDVKKRYDKEWKARNRERHLNHVKKAKAIYRIRHPDRVKATKRNWDLKNPEKASVNSGLRRARLLQVKIDNLGVEALVRVWKSNEQFVCFHCKQATPVKAFHLDHIVPISRGGGHTPDNVCPSCSFCNLSKGHRLLSEWTSPKLKLLQNGSN